MVYPTALLSVHYILLTSIVSCWYVQRMFIIYCITWLFAFCKGGTSWMRNKDWSTLDIGESWKWGVVLFKSNFIILHHYLKIDTKYII